MSRFLGPIHHWLFNKVIMFEEIEKNIIDNAKTNLGIDSNEISELLIQYPQSIGDKNLEDIIDTDNIHGWLQNKIAIAETRQAELIKYLVDKCGDEGKVLVLEVYKRAGISWGKEAKEKYEVSSAPDLYKTLNNYMLEGMPCDNVNNVIDMDMDLLTWRVSRCLHKDYWLKVNGDVDFMYELREALLTGFIEGANERYKYTFSKDNGILSHRISS